MIKLHGPPIRYWCMRFESFHYVLKRRAQFIGNFINICKSLASHVQRLHCLNVMEKEMLICTNTIFGPSEAGKSNLSFTDVIALLPVSLNREIPLDPSLTNSVHKWVKFQGWEYRPRRIIVIKKSYETESGLPKFALITNIIVQNNSTIFLVLSVLKTVSHETNYHSYLVEERSQEQFLFLSILSCILIEPLDFVLNFSNDSKNMSALVTLYRKLTQYFSNISLLVFLVSLTTSENSKYCNLMLTKWRQQMMKSKCGI